MDRVKDAEWTFLKGGIHLKLNGKSLFHFQRETEEETSNRYNVLWHIHRNLFYVTVKLVHTPPTQGVFLCYINNRETKQVEILID